MIATSRYILNNIASLTMDWAVLKQMLNKNVYGRYQQYIQ